jgi:hypothetical protein
MIMWDSSEGKKWQLETSFEGAVSGSRLETLSEIRRGQVSKSI